MISPHVRAAPAVPSSPGRHVSGQPAVPYMPTTCDGRTSAPTSEQLPRWLITQDASAATYSLARLTRRHHSPALLRHGEGPYLSSGPSTLWIDQRGTGRPHRSPLTNRLDHRPARTARLLLRRRLLPATATISTAERSCQAGCRPYWNGRRANEHGFAPTRSMRCSFRRGPLRNCAGPPNHPTSPTRQSYFNQIANNNCSPSAR